MLTNDFKIGVVYTKKLYGIEGVDCDDYFTQRNYFFVLSCINYLFTIGVRKQVYSQNVSILKTIYF